MSNQTPITLCARTSDGECSIYYDCNVYNRVDSSYVCDGNTAHETVLQTLRGMLMMSAPLMAVLSDNKIVVQEVPAAITSH
jgi:hypothetical protein